MRKRAIVVRRVFEMAASEENHADRLPVGSTKTHAYAIGLRRAKLAGMTKYTGLWSSERISDMLQNPVYGRYGAGENKAHQLQNEKMCTDEKTAMASCPEYT